MRAIRELHGSRAVDLDHLRAFLLVAREGGFSRAAAVFPTTQPTLSRQVRALEGELGRALFARRGRSVRLTEAGRALLPRAEDLLARADALVAERGRPAAAGPGCAGELQLAVADSVVLARLPAVLRRLAARHPRLAVRLRTATTPEILASLRAGTADAGLCMLPQAHPGLVLRPLWADRFVAIAPPRHALAGRRAPLERFAREPQVTLQAGTLAHQAQAAAFQAEGLALVSQFAVDTFHQVLELVAAGLGVGVVSAIEAREALARRRVARVRVARLDRLPRPLGLALPADRAPPPAVEALLEVLPRA
jgi:DNA-binding transcriptional LysR family regulator